MGSNLEVLVSVEQVTRILAEGYSTAVTCIKGLPKEGAMLKAVTYEWPHVKLVFWVLESEQDRLTPEYRLWSKAEALDYAERALT